MSHRPDPPERVADALEGILATLQDIAETLKPAVLTVAPNPSNIPFGGQVLRLTQDPT